MSKQTTSLDFVAVKPHGIEPHWDNVWARRLSGNEISAEANCPWIGRRNRGRDWCAQPVSMTQMELARQVSRASAQTWM